MKITSGKKAILIGFFYAVLIFVIYIGFTYMINYLTGGKPFVTKGETFEFINGISFGLVKITGIVLSAIIPMLLLRYRSVDAFMLCIFIAIICYIILFVVMVFGILSSLPVELILDCPLNTFDAMIYGLVIFPIGSIIGMIGTGIINSFINRKKIVTSILTTNSKNR